MDDDDDITLIEIMEGESDVWSVSFSHDGKWFASGDGRRINIWDHSSLIQFDTCKEEVLSMVTSANMEKLKFFYSQIKN